MSGEIERRGELAPAAGRTGRRGGSYDGPGYSAARKAGELDPEWVMVGVDVPAGKRLYASRDLKGSAFAVATTRAQLTRQTAGTSPRPCSGCSSSPSPPTRSAWLS